MKPNWIGKSLSVWPMNKLLREHQFAKVDLGKRHPWTRLLRVELIRRRHPERK